MPTNSRIERCFAKPVIPVLWKLPAEKDSIAHASAVILQGGSITELVSVIGQFEQPELKQIQLFVHIDLVSGLENNEAGLECLSQLPRIRGVVTIHHHLAKPAAKLGLLSIVRLFFSDSRAVQRGLAVAKKSRPDAIEILPAVAAVQAAADLRKCGLPRIAGGLCHTEEDVRKTLASGCHAVTSTQPRLWRLNA